MECPGLVTRSTDLHRRDVRDAVKLTFAKGASLDDLSGLFNSSLGGNTRRAIDFHDGDVIDKDAFKALIRAAVTLNTSSKSRTRKNGTQRQRSGELAIQGHTQD